MNKNQKYKRILIVRLDRIGDVLLSTPVIKAVRDAYPDSYIAFMVRPYALDIVEGNPYLNRVIVYHKSGGLFDNLRFIFALRRERFDLAIILHPTNRTHILTALAGIPERVGYDRKMGFLLTRRIPHLKQLGLKHEIDYTLDILQYIGIEPRERALYMPMRRESENKIDEIFARNGIKAGDTVVVLNPGASCISKMWPLENFARIGDMLNEGHGVRVVIISGYKDRAKAGLVAGSMKRPHIDLSGKTSVSDLASLLKRARLLISNDSGPVHIACAVSTPVVAIFGRRDRGLSPVRWGPSGRDDVVLHKDVGCAVCFAHNCRLHFKCLKAISVEEIFKAAEGILRRQP